MAKRKGRLTLPFSSSSSSSSLPPCSSLKKKPKNIPSIDDNPFWNIYGRCYRHDIREENDGDNDGDGDDRSRGENFVTAGEDHYRNQQFDKMLQFTELTRNMKTTNDGITLDYADTNVIEGEGRGQQQRLMEDLVDHLLGYMLSNSVTSRRSKEQKTRRATTSCFVSPEDIAHLLLPWAVKGILQDAYNKKRSTLPSSLKLLYWKSLEKCLCYLFECTEEKVETGTPTPTSTSTTRTGNNNFNSVLTLSTLHKIVPIALSLALEQEELTVTSETTSPTITIHNLANDCYCQLTDNLYRPPFDVLCDLLLPVLTRDRPKITNHQSLASKDTKMVVKKEDGGKKDDNNGVTTIWLRVTLSTIRLMISRVEDANPKKSFQLLVRPEVFLDLSFLYSKLLQIKADTINKEQTHILKTSFNALIREGIFSLENHMDGFRSLQLVPVFDRTRQEQKIEEDKVIAPATTHTTNSSFRCYQEGLLTTMEGYLIIDDKSSKSSSVSANLTSHLTPLLLDTFFEQASKMQQLQQLQTTNKSYKKTKNADKLGQQQFRFFSCLTGNLLKGFLNSKNSFIRKDIDSRLRVSLLAMIGKNLDLLLKYNVYQPSLGNNAEKSFLDKIGKEIIEFVTAQREEKNENGKQRILSYHISFTEWERSMRILETLFRLNHTILHDQLTEIIGKCLTYHSGKESDAVTVVVSDEASRFFRTIIATYGKLRQLDYFYKNFFDAISVLSREDESERLVQLLAFATDDEISRHIGIAIQASPIQQLKQIFSFANESIVSRSHHNKDDSLSSEITLVASSIITKLLQGLLRNVRVDSNSSNEIDPICKDVIQGPITRLMADSDGNINIAVMLCAWAIHLKNRCKFWVCNKQIGSFDQEKLDIPPSIHRFLKNATTIVEYETGDNSEEDNDLLKSLKFLACQRIQQLHGEFYEKQRLAYASHAEQYNTSREISEARELVGFMLQGCYSNNRESESKEKMRDQWAVLAESISIWAPYADENDINSFLNQLLQAVAIVGKSSGQRKKQISSLLNDSSFYEIPNVSKRLGTNVISFVAENIQKVLSWCDGTSPQFFKIGRPILHPDWKSLPFEEIVNAHQSHVPMTYASDHLVEINEILLGSLQVVETINYVCIPIWEDCDDAARIFESFLRIEFICIKLLSKCFDTVIQLISELRIAASRVLASISSQSNEKISGKQNEDFLILLPQILKTTSICLNHSPSPDKMHRCIHSCTTLVGSLVSICMSRGNKLMTELVQILDSTFNEDEVETEGGTNYFVLISYASTLLKKLRRSTDADVDIVVINEFFRIIQNRLWIKAQKYCFDPLENSNSLFRNKSRTFIAEALRFSSTYFDASVPPISSIETKIVVNIRDLLTRDFDEIEMRSISYLVGCYAMTEPSGIVRQELTNELLVATLEGYNVLLTPLCVLARGMLPNEFGKFLNKLTSTIVIVPATTIKLKILHMLALSVTNQSQVEEIAKYSSTIMSNCLQVMTQVAREVDVESDSILEVSSLIIDMASRKDIMILRERDIALILACITSTIRVDEDSTQKQMKEAHLKAYNASFLLVSFFLQRFSKQMHSCVPSLIISLTTMLQFALHEPMAGTSSSCGQKFSRLCELLLPHGEVYKKHIICLIVRFVDALQGTMNATCKKSLLPGIYCLLDIIQDHERMQLNSMLDEMGRALLRSLHEGYKKTHVYHGQ